MSYHLCASRPHRYSYNKFFYKNINTSTNAKSRIRNYMVSSTFPLQTLGFATSVKFYAKWQSQITFWFKKIVKSNFAQFISLLSLIFNPIQLSFRCTCGSGGFPSPIWCRGMLLNSDHDYATRSILNLADVEAKMRLSGGAQRKWVDGAFWLVWILEWRVEKSDSSKN